MVKLTSGYKYSCSTSAFSSPNASSNRIHPSFNSSTPGQLCNDIVNNTNDANDDLDDENANTVEHGVPEPHRSPQTSAVQSPGPELQFIPSITVPLHHLLRSIDADLSNPFQIRSLPFAASPRKAT